jgi:vacuolar-type H+-ATPase subunit E/Vma4
MRSLEENIESLTRAMISEAKGEAEQILVSAQARADSIRQQAQRQAEAQRAEILERAHLEAERLHGQAIATTQLKARTMELEHREKLLDNVFAASSKQLGSVQRWTDYDKTAQRLLYEALTQLRASRAKVQADQPTMKCLTSQVLEQVSKDTNTQITLGEPLQKGIGITVETADGHLHYDNTLENRLSRLQNSLRSPVYRLLIGEKL